jgi:hypothetical protein
MDRLPPRTTRCERCAHTSADHYAGGARGCMQCSCDMFVLPRGARIHSHPPVWRLLILIPIVAVIAWAFLSLGASEGWLMIAGVFLGCGLTILEQYFRERGSSS